MPDGHSARPRASAAALAALLLLAASPGADATVQVAFEESAPSDSVVIRNGGECGLRDVTLTLDLSTSAGRLIFDTLASGPGVDVYQPFRVISGEVEDGARITVADGASTLVLRIPSLPAGDGVEFTIDVDDTLPRSELSQRMIANAEIQGGRVTVALGDAAPHSARFDSQGVARVETLSCS